MKRVAISIFIIIFIFNISVFASEDYVSVQEAAELTSDININNEPIFAGDGNVTREAAAVAAAKLFEMNCGKTYALGKSTFISDFFDIDKANLNDINLAVSVNAVIYHEDNLYFRPKMAITYDEFVNVANSVRKATANFKSLQPEEQLKTTVSTDDSESEIINVDGIYDICALKDNAEIFDIEVSGSTDVVVSLNFDAVYDVSDNSGAGFYITDGNGTELFKICDTFGSVGGGEKLHSVKLIMFNKENKGYIYVLYDGLLRGTSETQQLNLDNIRFFLAKEGEKIKLDNITAEYEEMCLEKDIAALCNVTSDYRDKLKELSCRSDIISEYYGGYESISNYDVLCEAVEAQAKLDTKMIEVEDVVIENNTVKSISLLHKTESERSGTVICAFYSSGTFAGLKYVPMTYTVGEENPQSVIINADIPEAADTMKVFVFSDMTSIKPLSYRKEISLQKGLQEYE